MKVNDKTKPKKGKLKKKGGVVKRKPNKEKVLIVAKEIKYARLLCSNEKKTRDRVLKALKKWLTACFEKKYEFKEEDFMRVWKGLFFAVWMSDKPLIQEELCENIASILDNFPQKQISAAVLMMKAGFKTLATEWYGIDHHRMDKFLMLVRRYLRGSLRVLQRTDWNEKCCKKFARMLMGRDGLLALKTPHYARNATSMILHLIDCYLEEISKVSEGVIPPGSLTAVLKPPLVYMCRGGVATLTVSCRRLFTQLLRQSEPGIKHMQKVAAWKQMGCPEGGPDALETDDELSDDDADGDDDDGDGDDGAGDDGAGNDGTVDDGAGNVGAGDDTGLVIAEADDGKPKPLDPRAGRVDAELNPIPVPAEHIEALLMHELTKASSKAYTRIKICLERVQRVKSGAAPLPLAAVEAPRKTRRRRRAAALALLEQRLYEEADELRLRGLSRKHRKRLLRKSRSGLSILDDVEFIHEDKTAGFWTVESVEGTPDKEKKKTRKRKTQETSPILKKKRRFDVKMKNKDKLTEKHLNKNKIIKRKLKEKSEVVDKKQLKVDKRENSEKKELKDNSQIYKKDSQDKKELNLKTKQDKEKTESKDKTKIKDKKIKPLENSKNDSKNTNISKNSSKTDNFTKKSYRFDMNSVKIDKKTSKTVFETPKKVKFALKNNSMQKPIDYYKSVRQSPSIPYDGSKKPSKTNLKPCTPSPINPFFKKKLKIKK